jgi:hypothetical protein
MYVKKVSLPLKGESHIRTVAVTSGRASEELLFGFRQEQHLFPQQLVEKMTLKPIQPPNQRVSGRRFPQ